MESRHKPDPDWLYARPINDADGPQWTPVASSAVFNPYSRFQITARRAVAGTPNPGDTVGREWEVFVSDVYPPTIVDPRFSLSSFSFDLGQTRTVQLSAFVGNVDTFNAEVTLDLDSAGDWSDPAITTQGVTGWSHVLVRQPGGWIGFEFSRGSGSDAEVVRVRVRRVQGARVDEEALEAQAFYHYGGEDDTFLINRPVETAILPLSVAVLLAAPVAPATPVLQRATTTTLQVEVGLVPGASSYEWTITPTNGGTPTTLTGLGRRFIFTALTPGTSYDIFCVAVNSVGRSPQSPVLDGATTLVDATSPPARVDDVDILSSTQTTMILTWGDAARAESYTATITAGTTTITRAITSPIVEFTGLTPGTIYAITVVAINSFGSSAPSAPARFITLPSTPSAPIRVSATTESIQVRVAPVPSATSYTFSISGTNAPADAVSADPEHTFTGLDAGTEYTITCRAGNDMSLGGGLSPPSTPSLFPTIPPRPNLPVVVSTTANAITLRVDPVMGADDYEWAIGAIRSFGPATHTISGINPAQAHNISVRARNSSGLSQASPQILDVRLPPGQAARPIVVSSTATTLLCNVPVHTPGAASYEWNITSAAGLDEDRASTSTSHNFFGLERGVAYTIRVRAINNAGAGPWSPNLVTGPAPARPDAPTLSNIVRNAFDAAVAEVEHSDSYVWRIIGGNADRTPMRTDNDISYSMLTGREEYTVTAASSFLGTDSLPSEATTLRLPFEPIQAPFLVSVAVRGLALSGRSVASGRTDPFLDITVGVPPVTDAESYTWSVARGGGVAEESAYMPARNWRNPNSNLPQGVLSGYSGQTNTLTISVRLAETQNQGLGDVRIAVRAVDRHGDGGDSATLVVSLSDLDTNPFQGRVRGRTWIGSSPIRSNNFRDSNGALRGRLLTDDEIRGALGRSFPYAIEDDFVVLYFERGARISASPLYVTWVFDGTTWAESDEIFDFIFQLNTAQASELRTAPTFSHVPRPVDEINGDGWFRPHSRQGHSNANGELLHGFEGFWIYMPITTRTAP